MESGRRIDESCAGRMENEGGSVYIQMRSGRNGGLLFAWKFGVWVLHWARE